jgi:hypothetical protein
MNDIKSGRYDLPNPAPLEERISRLLGAEWGEKSPPAFETVDSDVRVVLVKPAGILTSQRVIGVQAMDYFHVMSPPGELI